MLLITGNKQWRNKLNSFVIQSKDKYLLKKSTSGGMFAELAKYVLSKQGIVFGCTMERVEEGFDVKHIYIEDEKDLYKLQGSKYVQSNLKNTIKEAKEFLDNGRLVLFSGTPCQIAGLKAFLNQDYENLITVDISCEGTPSLEVFNGYIKYLEKNVIKHKIVDLKFRPKDKCGWSCNVVVVVYQVKDRLKEKVLYTNLSSYFTCFFKGDILQDRCFKCKYTGVNRVGDITICDAWGIEHEYPELLKSKFDSKIGISLALINSDKGQKVFEIINKNLVVENVDIRKMRKYNHPLRHPSIKSSKWNNYFEAYKNGGYEGVEELFRKESGIKYYYQIIKNHTPKWIKSIIKLFMSTEEKVDCLLMTWYFYSNYGSILAAYALNKTMQKLGYKSKIIHYANLKWYNKSFAKKHFLLTKRCLNVADYLKLNKLTNTFIIGSDNLLDLVNNGTAQVSKNLFNFAANDKKLLMISGSLGAWDGTTEKQEEYDYLKYLFNRFSYISTREEQGKQILKNVFDVEADWINDPVFYLDKDDYMELTKEIKEDYSDKIMEYILYPTEQTNKIVDFYKQKMGLSIAKFDGNENVKFFSRHNNKSVENWLSAIINSRLIITDSFHCTAFALIFNKPFICLKNNHATIRFISLFKRLGINIPLVENVEMLKNIDLDYNKEQVNNSIASIKIFALNKIEQAMLKPKRKVSCDEKIEKKNCYYIKNIIPWYKKNKLFYYGMIIPFVNPLVDILKYLERIRK